MELDALLPVSFLIRRHEYSSLHTAATASSIALGHDVKEAVKMACRYVEKGIKTAIPRGKGSGPINHFHSVQHLPS